MTWVYGALLLSRREQKLLLFSENLLHTRNEKEGRLRRRHYGVLDAGFFSAPAIHRKTFAKLKAGILAMESAGAAREHYLERNWPPAFWSYLEACHRMPLHAQNGLAELKDKSFYYNVKHIMGIANMLQATAAYRAPVVFLEMAGDDPAPIDHGFPEYTWDYIADIDLPSIGACRAGLFASDEAWKEKLVFDLAPLISNIDAELINKIFSLKPEELAMTPPKGTPDELITFARKWRLHQLRQLSKCYINSEYINRRVARQMHSVWPYTQDNTVAPISDSVFNISRIRPKLIVRVEFEQQSRHSGECHQFWKFKALLTQRVPDEVEDVVGYMSGWLVALFGDEFVSDEEETLLDEAQAADPMLGQGISAFLNGYLSSSGYENMAEFMRSRKNPTVAISEIVFREKYKSKGLMALAFAGLSAAHTCASVTDYPKAWRGYADFNIPTNMVCFDNETPEVITSPSVFMVPAPRSNKRLRGHLMGASTQSSLDEEELDIFPFHPGFAMSDDQD